jgi:hypothetical protein
VMSVAATVNAAIWPSMRRCYGVRASSARLESLMWVQ